MLFVPLFLRRLLPLLALAAFLLAAAAPVFSQSAPPPASAAAAPTADSVTEDALLRANAQIRGRISIPDAKASVLEQPQGRTWRGFHESYLPWIAGLAILLMLAALIAFYLWKGPVRLERRDLSAQKIRRFSGPERFAHWLIAVSFLIQAATGLNYVFGKRLLLPLMSPHAFAELTEWSKALHLSVAWAFALGWILVFVFWVRDNLPIREDWAWLKSFGGFFDNRRVHAGKFNAGQKIMFWSVTVGGALMIASGLLLMFPFSVLDVNGMQVMNGVHALVGALFVAGILAHIYIGTVGMEGAFDAMGKGEVDLAWAEHHHDLWVREERARAAPRPSPGE